MNNIRYLYDVKITAGSVLLQHELLGGNFPSIGELAFISKKFDQYEECKTAFTGLLSVLCEANTKATQNNHVIVTQLNPMHTENAVVPEEESWDKTIFIKAFIAEANELKHERLKFQIMGHIKVDQASVDAVKNLAADKLIQ